MTGSETKLAEETVDAAAPAPAVKEEAGSEAPADRSKGAMPDPSSLMGDGEKEDLPEVEQLGVITLETLNAHHCNNPDRRLMCLFGEVYDVTSAVDKYGPDGSYCEFAGHDITLTLGAGQMGDKWLDKFIKVCNILQCFVIVFVG